MMMPAPAAMPLHPSLSLPDADQAIARSQSHARLRNVLEKNFKLDMPSLAGFVRRAHGAGWVSDDALATMVADSGVDKRWALYQLAGQATTCLSENTDLTAAFTPSFIAGVEDNLGSEAIDANGVQALGHAAIHAGIVGNDTMAGALGTMNNLNHQFPRWFEKQATGYVEQQAAANLGLDTLMIESPIAFDCEGHFEGALIYMHNGDDMTVNCLYMPRGSSNNAIMLRDVLCMMGDVLRALDIFHCPMELMAAGGFAGGDDVAEMREALGDLEPTEANIRECVRRVAIAEYINDGGDRQYIESMSHDLDDMLGDSDVFEILSDHFCGLLNSSMFGIGTDDWFAMMTELVQEGHWSGRDSNLPPHLQWRQWQGNERDYEQAVAALFSEHIKALDTAMGDTIPETVAELTRIAAWLEARAEEGRLDVYLEDADFAEGLEFDLSFTLAPGMNPSPEKDQAGFLPLGTGEWLALESLGMDTGNAGTQPRAIHVMPDEDGEQDEAKKLMEIGATYATLAEAMARLERARKNEQIAA